MDAERGAVVGLQGWNAVCDMSYISMLIHRCTVQRATLGVPDIHGQPSRTWGTLATGVKCNLQWRSVTEKTNDGLLVSRQSEVLFVPVSQDITERDRIVNIRNLAGTLVDNGPFYVTQATRYRGRKKEHHRQLVLSRVTPADV